MKKTTFILQAVLFLSTSLCAQQTPRQYSFDAHAKYYADAFDVKWTMPKGMVDLDTMASLLIRKGYRLINSAAPVLRSQDGEFVLMYNSNPLFVSDEMAKFYEESKALTRKVQGPQAPDASGPARNNDNVHRLRMSSELGTVYGYCDEIARPLPGKPFPLDKYIDVLPEKTARGWFNADSVFVYNLPVDTPYKSTFKHCTGVIITKKDRTGFALKLYLTDEGKKNEKRYLRSLRKTIWYNNPKWEYDKEVEQQAARRYLYNSESE